MEERIYSVSEAVRLVGVESHVLRYWEEELHISIQRNAQGHRIYSRDEIALFQKVKDWKEKGLQLKAIRVLIGQTGAYSQTGTYGQREPETFEEQLEEVFDRQGQTGCGDSVCDIEGDSCVCEIVLTNQKETPDNLTRIAAVFRQIIKEAAEEQNEYLEQVLTKQLREEAKDLYLQYFQMLQEAAAAKQEARGADGHHGRLRRIWEAICGGQ